MKYLAHTIDSPVYRDPSSLCSGIIWELCVSSKIVINTHDQVMCIFSFHEKGKYKNLFYFQVNYHLQLLIIFSIEALDDVLVWCKLKLNLYEYLILDLQFHIQTQFSSVILLKLFAISLLKKTPKQYKTFGLLDLMWNLGNDIKKVSLCAYFSLLKYKSHLLSLCAFCTWC